MVLSLSYLDFLNWLEIANVPTVVIEMIFLRRLVGLHRRQSLLLFLKNRFTNLYSALVQIVLAFQVLSGLNRQFSLREGR